MITIESFKVLKKLSVTNLQIETKKVKASYFVEKMSGEINSFDLIYSYEHAYFNKKSASDVNLASMMLAQVAINYGLFFETIEFDGLFDKTDQQFIKAMVENTSREILTNKLLIKNEFLKAPFDNLLPEKKDKYTQANIIFSNTRFPDFKLEKEEQQPDYDKYAILSSGGKDSLLSYGIITEIADPYPVFINEAGRHWFSAVNSYRHYKNTEPNTEKPWCNSDRLFNWMLKQLPFIKENYSNIRADIYPIRLWTVAVFLFGVLPVARKKGIGNILIGDEYDTTVKGNLNGITHYNALYDQSKYFDNALSRYYRDKGWNMYQFSILRSLSEMLIMKVLIKRYPNLQKHQVSCHAAHEVDGKMYPCGKCEKCRRIIGMVKALDESPEACGYNQQQIDNGLQALASKSVKQIGSDAAHLYHMLLDKNLIEKNTFTEKAAKKHNEIMKLRFDAERSNLEDLPQHIRKPLFEIFAEYADGSVKRENNKWLDFELNDDFLKNTKYKFDEK
ncbi:hypothetical protein [uncultured Draconibacterium sp.]|uniref:hypothetical protein n=1 Tax=uncultured Draconibacterium sp. TaxID=1573823 RepID=UPI003216581C